MTSVNVIGTGLGLTVIVVSILIFVFARSAAIFFARIQRPVYGDRIAGMYTTKRVRYSTVGTFIVGIIMVTIGLVGGYGPS
ncbi:hypothetical protein BH09ACT4_BH09ACT4_12770 [soil metagenome]